MRARPRQVADGFLDIAVENMANAIKHISVQRGYDVTEYTLCCFGGAGGQHACLVADALGMTRVFIHPLAGVLSAYGMGLADVRALRQQAVEARLVGRVACASARRRSTRWRTPAAREVARAGRRGRRAFAASARCTSSTRAPTRRSRCRSTSDDAAIVAEFERRYRQQYGFLMPGKPLVIEAVAVEAIGRSHDVDGRAAGVRAARGPARADPHQPDLHAQGAWRDAAVYAREDLRPGDAIDGPAVIREPNATTVDRAGLARDADGARPPRARARRGGAARACDRHDRRSGAARGVQQPVHGDRRADGRDARQHAYSVNIKERLDFSCALFDAEGNLIANAPHMPVHLGSMGESVKTIIDRRAGTMQPRRRVRAERALQRRHAPAGRHGDRAGVSRRAASARSARARILRGVARPPRRHRRHHARLDAARLDARRRGGRAARQRAARRAGPLPRSGDARDPRIRAAIPSRNVDQNLADLRAQVAACAKGADELAKMVDALRPAGRARLHAARAGQRGGSGAARARRAVRRPLRVRDGQRRGDPRGDHRRSAKRARRRSTSPARARSSRRTSTRRPPSARPRCSTCSARSSTTRSR